MQYAQSVGQHILQQDVKGKKKKKKAEISSCPKAT